MKVNLQTIYHILILSTVGVLLFACGNPTLAPDQMDRSTFTGIPCAAPCWYGLVVGRSSEHDVMSTLSTLTFIDQDTVEVFRGTRPTLNYEAFAPGAEIAARCTQPKQQCLTLTVANDILTNITVILNYEMRVDEAIRYLGDPDYIGYQDLGAERIICEAYMVWVGKQLVLATAKFEGRQVETNCDAIRDTERIRSDLLVAEARYMSSTAIESLLSTDPNKFFDFSGTTPEK